MSSAQNAVKLCPCPAISNSIHLEWISSISRTASFVSSSIAWTRITDASCQCKATPLVVRNSLKELNERVTVGKSPSRT